MKFNKLLKIMTKKLSKFPKAKKLINSNVYVVKQITEKFITQRVFHYNEENTFLFYQLEIRNRNTKWFSSYTIY